MSRRGTAAVERGMIGLDGVFFWLTKHYHPWRFIYRNHCVKLAPFTDQARDGVPDFGFFKQQIT
jgi:hypothetical protein